MATRKRIDIEKSMRVATPIPCQKPFDWLPEAVQLRMEDETEAAKAKLQWFEKSPARVVRELLWDGLEWLDHELEKNRWSIRPIVPIVAPRPAENKLDPVTKFVRKQSAMLPPEEVAQLAARAAVKLPVKLTPEMVIEARQRITPRIAYSLVGKYIAIPERLEEAVERLNARELSRYRQEVAKFIRAVGEAGADKEWSISQSATLHGDRVFQINAVVEAGHKLSLPEQQLLASLTKHESIWSKSSLARALLARGLKEYAPAGFEQ